MLRPPVVSWGSKRDYGWLFVIFFDACHNTHVEDDQTAYKSDAEEHVPHATVIEVKKANDDEDNIEHDCGVVEEHLLIKVQRQVLQVELAQCLAFHLGEAFPPSLYMSIHVV